MLHSINARLGALLPPGADAGFDLPPLGSEWLGSLAEMARLNAEAQEEALEAARVEGDHGG